MGDAAYRPLSEQDVLALLAELLGDRIAVRTVHEVARELPACEDVTSTLQRLAGV
ncbi:hypothetical protein ACFQ0B_77990 [Nonomuraea thailandensis]